MSLVNNYTEHQQMVKGAQAQLKLVASPERNKKFISEVEMMDNYLRIGMYGDPQPPQLHGTII